MNGYAHRKVAHHGANNLQLLKVFFPEKSIMGVNHIK